MYIEYKYHVRVVPVSGGRVGSNHVLVVAVVVDYALYAGPRVLDVVKVSPQIASLGDGRIIGLRKTKHKTRLKKIYHNVRILPCIGVYMYMMHFAGVF